MRPDLDSPCIGTVYDDIWLVNGMRTGFADYNGTLGQVSPTDLGIAAARAALERSGVPASDVELVIATNLAQASFDAYYLPRHIGLYAGVPRHVPATLVHRLCGSGFETIAHACDAIKLGKADVVLCAGAESMSRNPVASYTLRGGFAMGRVEFKDFLWEAFLDTAPEATMGHTAENLAREYGIDREAVDDFAALSFARAVEAQRSGYLAGEIVPLTDQTFEAEGCRPRGIRLPRGVEQFDRDEHIRETPREVLGRLKPAFGGVQTGGNSSGIVDGAAACLVVSGRYLRERGLTPLARVAGATAVGVPPEIMGIGPAPAIRGLLRQSGLALEQVGRFEINEAFGAQYLAVERELGLDRERVNVHGGAIAIGHPLGATGLRCTLTLARELQASGERYGVSSACCGGGQGVALLLENAGAA
ncbi:MAG: thiolase family protein [Gammaproteobacteria bacterium]